MQRFRLFLLVTVSLLLLSAAACADTPAPATPVAEQGGVRMPTATPDAAPVSHPDVDFGRDLAPFESATFSDPTVIDNQWLPLQPGMQWTYEGVTEEGGQRTPHRVIFTVTDLTKMIDGIQTRVVWDQDYSDDVLVETELVLFAQDDEGNVWHLGQYPEVYENGRLVETPAWVHGLKGAKAGIMMKATPQLGAPSYSQGWGPAVNWTDRAQVAEMGQETCVPFDCFENILIMEEFSQEEPGAFQLKYYAPGVGNVRVGWRGADATREVLELVEYVQLSPEEMDRARSEALELEARAYELSKEVYDQTPPAERLAAAAGS